MSILRLYLAQINPVVGDIKGNFNLISEHIRKAEEKHSDIVIFPELALTGYPPEDLLLKNAFINENLRYINKIKENVKNLMAVVGFAGAEGGTIYNSAAVMESGEIKSVYYKQLLPNYSVFDEERYFRKGLQNYIYKLGDTLLGINICEDIFYSAGPASIQSLMGGAEVIINISASPYYIGKIEEREKMLSTRAMDNRVIIVYVNMVGGQDELVFDGNSLIINERGKIITRGKPFEEDVIIYDLNTDNVSSARFNDAKFKKQKLDLEESYRKQPGNGKLPALIIMQSSLKTSPAEKEPEKEIAGKNTSITDNRLMIDYRKLISCEEEEVFKALILGTRDYVKKNGFSKALIALSGGIDSVLTTILATFALGRDKVETVLMPSMFSSPGSVNDSMELIKKLGIAVTIVNITDIYEQYITTLDKMFKNDEINITKENLQARIRGNIAMAFSNENGWLVLATGNKSEVSVGYCTLYGDMAGGFSPIKDVYKTMVYRICSFVNKKYDNLIPANILTKAPSAELKPDQKDQDKLPPYELLDAILKAYVEDDKGYDSIVSMGFDEKIVKKVINMVDNSEYKRRQGSPGIKITARAYGKDRRYPITNRFKLT